MTKKVKQKKEQATDTSSAKLSHLMITGYQYGGDGRFIGAYRFEKNLDKDELHCPACTVLAPPPADLPADEEAYFDGEQWQVRKLTLSCLPDQSQLENQSKEHKEPSNGN